MGIVASASDGREHARHHRERPTGCNHHPPAAFRFRSFEQHGSNNSIAEQYQNHRSEKFTGQR